MTIENYFFRLEIPSHCRFTNVISDLSVNLKETMQTSGVLYMEKKYMHKLEN